jgi:ribosomal protein S18 acetylase RimI-like enzyme
MIIRIMEARDVDRVADLLTQLGYPSTPQQIARRFTRVDGRDNQALLVADDGSAVVGWMHVGAHPYLESDDSAEILGLVVAEEQRSRGIGAALVSAAENWAIEHGYQVIRVRSRITRDRAHAFYERGGFERIKTQHCFQKVLRSHP